MPRTRVTDSIERKLNERNFFFLRHLSVCICRCVCVCFFLQGEYMYNAAVYGKNKITVTCMHACVDAECMVLPHSHDCMQHVLLYHGLCTRDIATRASRCLGGESVFVSVCPIYHSVPFVVPLNFYLSGLYAAGWAKDTNSLWEQWRAEQTPTQDQSRRLWINNRRKLNDKYCQSGSRRIIAIANTKESHKFHCGNWLFHGSAWISRARSPNLNLTIVIMHTHTHIDVGTAWAVIVLSEFVESLLG